MSYLNNLPFDLQIKIWKNVFNGAIKEAVFVRRDKSKWDYAGKRQYYTKINECNAYVNHVDYINVLDHSKSQYKIKMKKYLT